MKIGFIGMGNMADKSAANCHVNFVAHYIQ